MSYYLGRSTHEEVLAPVAAEGHDASERPYIGPKTVFLVVVPNLQCKSCDCNQILPLYTDLRRHVGGSAGDGAGVELPLGVGRQYLQYTVCLLYTAHEQCRYLYRCRAAPSYLHFMSPPVLVALKPIYFLSPQF